MPPAAARNGSVDALRMVAAFGIVWFHAQAPGAAFAYAGLAVFLELALIFTLSQDRGQPLGQVARSRFDRVMRPWLWWSLIYAMAKLAQMHLTGSSLSEEFQPSMLVTGTALHLWFLPYVAVLGLAALAVARRVKWPVLAPFLAWISLPVAVVLQGAAGADLPWPQWSNASGAALSGAALGLWLRNGGSGLVLAAALALSGAAGLFLQGDLGGPVLSWCLGTALVALTLHLPLPASPLTHWAARMAMPVYLIHPMAISALSRVDGLPSWAVALGACAGSLVAGNLLCRGRVERLLF